MRSNQTTATVVVVGGRIYISKPAPEPSPLSKWLTRKAVSGVDKISDRILYRIRKPKGWDQ